MASGLQTDGREGKTSHSSCLWRAQRLKITTTAVAADYTMTIDTAADSATPWVAAIPSVELLSYLSAGTKGFLQDMIEWLAPLITTSQNICWETTSSIANEKYIWCYVPKLPIKTVHSSNILSCLHNWAWPGLIFRLKVFTENRKI